MSLRDRLGGEMSLWERMRGGPQRRCQRARVADRLYHDVVAQARAPAFFRGLGVPDDRGGRLEMVGLHAMLVMRRLGRSGPAGRELAQALFDLMFNDIDRHLREWGVGDLSVGKYVKRIAQSFMGRVNALEPLLATGDVVGCRPILRRNLYTESPATPDETIDRLSAYLMAQDSHLRDVDDGQLFAGTVAFAAVDRLLGLETPLRAGAAAVSPAPAAGPPPASPPLADTPVADH